MKTYTIGFKMKGQQHEYKTFENLKDAEKFIIECYRNENCENFWVVKPEKA